MKGMMRNPQASQVMLRQWKLLKVILDLKYPRIVNICSNV